MALRSKECQPNYLRTQSVKSKGEAPGSARVLPQKAGKATQRGTKNKNVKI